MKFVVVLAYVLLGVFVLGLFWAIAWKAVWVVLPITLLFLISLYFPLPLKATTRHAKALQVLRSALHYGFCYLVVPAGFFVLFIAIGYFKAYPATASMLRGFAAFLFVLPATFILRENRRGLKLSVYFFIMVLVVFAAPQYWVPNSKAMGGLMARAWIAQLSGKPFRSLEEIHYTVVGETEGILLVSLPPTMLFISAQEKPYCVGHPQEAAQICQETLAQLIHSQIFVPPAARENEANQTPRRGQNP
jgi:hypothetical protein